MSSLFDALPYLSAYHPSFLVLACLSLLTLAQNFATAPLAFLSEEQMPGMPLRFDHSKLSFRALRAYSNSTESFPAFGWALLAAIVAGGSPVLVNWLAVLYLCFRMAFCLIYYSGVGKPVGGPRTMAFVGGLLANIGLALIAIWALVF